MADQTDSRLIPGILTAGGGAALIWQGTRMPHPNGWATSPGLFPVIIGGVLVLLAVLLMIEGWRLRRAGSGQSESVSTEDDEAAKPRITVLVVAIPVALASYILVLDYLGFEITTWLFLVIGMWAFGERSIVRIVIAATAFTLVITVLFTQVLQTLLPGGPGLTDWLLY